MKSPITKLKKKPPKISVLKKKLLISKGYKPRRGVVKVCPICKTVSYRRQSHAVRIFCGKKCADKNQLTGKEYKCEICGKFSYRNNGQVKHRGKPRFCSKRCKGDSLKIMIRKMGYKPIKTTKKISTLKKKLWKVFALWIKIRDKYTCITCGVKCEGSNAHAGHFIPKSVGGMALYFHEDNVHVQCARCNIWLSGNQYEYAKRLGTEKAEELLKLKQQTTIWTAEDYLGKIYLYEQKLKELG